MTTTWIQLATSTLDRMPVVRRLGARVRRIAIIVAGITLLAAGAIGASMTALSWNNAGGGAAATAANWAPAQVPTSSDDLTFNLNNTYTVTYNSSVPSSRSHTYRQGIVTLSATSPHTVTNGIVVGSASGDIATATLTTGTVTSGNIVGNGAVTVASASGSIGTLNVNDDDADLILATSTGDLTVAAGGAGLLNVTNGGLVQVADRFTVGSNSTSSSTVTVSGFSVAPVGRSTLIVNGTGPAAAIGAGGDVVMTVNTGALADFAGDVNVAQGSASTSTLSVAGVGLVDAQIDVGGDLNIGRNQAGGSAGGVGTVNVNADAALNVAGTLNVAGDPDGGTGTLHLADGGAITAGSFAVGPGGTLDLDGGALDVNGGTFTFTNPAVDFVLGGVDSPAVTLTSADATFQANATTTALTVGGGAGSNPAGLTLLAGSTLTIPAGDIVLGQTSDNAFLYFDSADLNMPTTAKLIVGQSAKARIEARSGTNMTGGDVFIGQNAGSDGRLVMNVGTNAASFQRVYVGGSNTAAGGTGWLKIDTGSVLNANDTAVNVKVWPSGTLDVSGTLNSPSVIQVLGSARVFDGGAINASTMLVESGGELFGLQGSVAANVQANSGSLITVGSQSLTLGNAASGSGFVNNGTLAINSGVATILDANTANVNTASLAGGTLVVPNGATLANGTTLSGHGTVDADVANFGTIIAADSGLVFKGVVNGVGQGFFGTRVSFIEGGGFTGTGGIVADITGDSTSLITPTGSLTLGNASSTSGIDFDGALNVANRSVTLFDADLSALGGPVTIGAGGTLATSNGLLLKNGGSITGSGSVNTRLTGELGSSIVATGPLAIGLIADSLAMQTESRIDAGAFTLTLRAADVRLRRATTIAGGTLLLDSPDPAGVFIFLGGSSLIGSGVLANGSVFTQPGAVITASGTLTMGRSDTGSGFDARGALNVGPHIVNLLDPAFGELGSLTTIDGGTITCNKDLEIAGAPLADVVRGTGEIVASSLFRSLSNSIVEPGNPIGTLTVGQNFEQQVGGELSIELGGAGALAGNPGEPREGVSKSGSVVWDQLIVPGTATIAGTLRVAQLPGLVVATGDSFPILSCGALVGTFGVVVFDDPYLDNAFDVVYTPTAVVLVARATTGVDLPPIGDASDDDDSDDGGVIAGAIPASYGLRVSGRNPFSASDGAAFEYDVPRSSAPVAISVFDVSGRRIADLVSGAQFAGTHAASWRGGELNALPSGVYFLRMDAAGFGETKRLVLLR
ncbi:MAG: beta strand repeat-containing protein [bacterium]